MHQSFVRQPKYLTDGGATPPRSLKNKNIENFFCFQTPVACPILARSSMAESQVWTQMIYKWTFFLNIKATNKIYCNAILQAKAHTEQKCRLRILLPS